MGSACVLFVALEATSGHGLDGPCNVLSATPNGVDARAGNAATDKPAARHGRLQSAMPGSGDRGHESRFKQFDADYPEQAAMRIGYDEKLAHALRADFCWYGPVRKGPRRHVGSTPAAGKRA